MPDYTSRRHGSGFSNVRGEVVDVEEVTDEMEALKLKPLDWGKNKETSSTTPSSPPPRAPPPPRNSPPRSPPVRPGYRSTSSSTRHYKARVEEDRDRNHIVVEPEGKPKVAYAYTFPESSGGRSRHSSQSTSKGHLSGDRSAKERGRDSMGPEKEIKLPGLGKVGFTKGSSTVSKYSSSDTRHKGKRRDSFLRER